ncbi:MAG: 2-amino-4-hydroxy-6-hydroxymethyldihydropteridine diphosphokinase [Gammaproteobacteria bacterium]|nr:2-amino-4-hydroxy-6-hydroxymethyldihydropteridine diphosphokinase [Gammaproteobacteria bacterium]
MTRAFIGIGSNLESPAHQVLRAVSALAAIPGLQLLARSSLYASAALDHTEQPDYINAVAQVQWQASAQQLLLELQRLENDFGRVRTIRWGPRIIDLDILLFGDESITSEALTVPHAGLAQRAFVLLPLAEIAPELVVPGLPPLAAMIADCPAPAAQRIVGSQAAANVTSTTLARPEP